MLPTYNEYERAVLKRRPAQIDDPKFITLFFDNAHSLQMPMWNGYRYRMLSLYLFLLNTGFHAFLVLLPTSKQKIKKKTEINVLK